MSTPLFFVITGPWRPGVKRRLAPRDPVIQGHSLRAGCPWMHGSSPGMTWFSLDV